ncbi:PREDICTED: olfactory receptor 6M1-like [Nanorana parkeri]|uniref:olfactory receptor 6M1-like n=1 Tax=Nanorana parkeri TaxID=125878 RepID=UPI000853FD12|nr:PREDICTED: olfactory receptor 6M1-like [Nanorana parkeri]
MNVNISDYLAYFILHGFPAFQFWQWNVFGIILFMYLLTITENIIIITIVLSDSLLNSPMYFFIGNLSFIEMLYTSVTIPKLLALLIGKSKSISLTGCLTQFFFFFSLGSAECFLLAVMSYDRYCAICHPLLYNVIMNRPLCCYLVLACWIGGFIPNLFPTVLLSQLHFCDRYIEHFFCDLSPLLQLSCSNTNRLQTLNFLTASAIVVFSFSLTLWTYIRIIMTILAIPSTTGKFKTFSTCASHLTVVTIFFGTVAFVYVRPRASKDFELNKVLSVVYIVLTPVVNPLIYSFRNKDVKTTIKKRFLQEHRQQH